MTVKKDGDYNGKSTIATIHKTISLYVNWYVYFSRELYRYSAPLKLGRVGDKPTSVALLWLPRYLGSIITI